MLLSAPPMTVLGVLVLVWVFRSDLKAIMSRIATIKFLGGELSTTSQIDRSAKAGPDELPPGSTGQKTALPESKLWEYRYLNFYFVPNTHGFATWQVSHFTVIENGFEG